MKCFSNQPAGLKIIAQNGNKGCVLLFSSKFLCLCFTPQFFSFSRAFLACAVAAAAASVYAQQKHANSEALPGTGANKEGTTLGKLVRVFAWGSAQHGQCGQGDQANVYVPTVMSLPLHFAKCFPLSPSDLSQEVEAVRNLEVRKVF